MVAVPVEVQPDHIVPAGDGAPAQLSITAGRYRVPR
jgi:hypothetical protein